MRITVKTGGLYTRLLPEGTSGNTAEIDVPDGSTPLGVVEHMGVPAHGRFLLVVNDKAVPPLQRDTMILSDGDRVSLMPPLKGG